MNRLHIRDAQDSDRAAIQMITLSAYEEYAALMPAHWEEYRQGILVRLAGMGSPKYLVAEQDGTNVGSVLLYLAGTEFPTPDGGIYRLAYPEVGLLAVTPAARGQGIGAALMQECIKRAREDGAQVLTLHTTEMMQVAMRMYERIGFMHVPELDFRVAEDLLLLGYRLALDEPTQYV